MKITVVMIIAILNSGCVTYVKRFGPSDHDSLCANAAKCVELHHR